MATNLSEIHQTQAFRMACATSREESTSSKTYSLNGTGTLLSMPVAWFPSPSLQFHGFATFKIAGLIDIGAAAAPANDYVIGFRLIDNNAAISGIPAPTISITSPTGGAGAFVFECDLFVIGSHDQDDRILMRQTLTIINNNHSENSVNKVYRIITTLGQRTDHQLSFSVTVGVNGTAVANNLTCCSFTCPHFGQRSDS